MERCWKTVRRFIRDEDAPTMMEYGLLVILIAFVALAGATALGLGVGNLFQTAANDYP